MAVVNQAQIDRLHGSRNFSSSNPFGIIKPIYDRSGNLVGIDTGTQSRYPTEAERLIYGNQQPIRRGGGGGDLPQSSPTEITPAAASGQTMESVRAQTNTLRTIQENLRRRAGQEAIKSQITARAAREQILNANILREIQKSKVYKKGRNILDFALGGRLTESDLNKQEEALSKRIETFNKIYGERELERDQYNFAKDLSESLDKQQKEINKARDVLAVSYRSKIQGILSPLEKRLTSKQQEELIKSNQPLIKNKENKIKEIDQRIEKLEGKSLSIPEKILLRSLKTNKYVLKKEIDRLSVGGRITVAMGELPISIPAASIPRGITTIKFLGTQKRGAGGRIITDIIFQTSKGRIGIAKGVTAVKGKKGITVFLGRSGQRFIRFPSGKTSINRIQSFAGIEKSVSSEGVLRLRNQIQLAKKLSSREAGTVNIIRNFKAIAQKSLGRIASAKGTKLTYPVLKFPLNKIYLKKASSFTLSDFISLSKVLTKKDLSLIIGRSITREGNKSKFIGLIKGIKDYKTMNFTPSETRLYSRALKRVVTQMAGAIGAAEKTTDQSNRLTIAAINLKNLSQLRPQIGFRGTPSILQVKPTMPFRETAKVIEKEIIKPSSGKFRDMTGISKFPPQTSQIFRNLGVIEGRFRSNSRQLQFLKSNQSSRQRDLLINRLRLKNRQLQTQFQRQIQRLVQRLRVPLSQKTIQRQLRSFYRQGFFFPKIPRFPFLIPGGKKKRMKELIPGKKSKYFDVFAKPIKKGNRYIKVNKSPLSFNQARDLRNYITDTSLSRRAQVLPSRNKPGRMTINFPKGYAAKTRFKFRDYRIVNGRKIPLPKGTLIETNRHLLDTNQEKQRIDLARRIKQLQIKGKGINRKINIKDRMKYVRSFKK